MSRSVDRLSLVYDARGGVVGELAYAIGRARGIRHCALCGLTHGRVRERPAWRAFRASLPVPVRAFHRTTALTTLRLRAGGAAPAVVAHAGNDAVLLLDPKQLEGIGGDLEAFGSALETARLAAALDWPGRQTS
ncbi:MAG: hypothetical protein H0T61_14065 [Actinobacteria bacterium]|nr:hypothetical protein [Actinomycetota bacterium]